MMKFRYFLASALVCSMALTAYSCADESENSEPVPTVTEMKVSASALTYSATGGSTYVYVVAASKPALTSDASWLRVTEQTSTSTITYKYLVECDRNADTSDRSASISVSSGNGSSSISVAQEATYGLVLSQTSAEVAYTGGEVSFELKSNGDYTMIIDGSSWISQSTTRANMSSQTLTFTVAANPGAARTGEICFSLGGLIESFTISQAANPATEGITSTAMQIASRMYPGINLGNTLEANTNSLGAETTWQPTKTTQAYLDFVKQQGFRAVRIPCSWDCHSDADGKIDSDWMKRVREVVDYCINDGLYVELNDHWDGGWIEVLGFSQSSSSYKAVDDAWIATKAARLKDIWTQIATEFRAYDEHLLFGGMNEPFQEYNLFSNRHEAMTPILATYNKAFVEAVRATGGNNLTRTLVVQGPSVSMASTVSYYALDQMPEEAGHLMMECHFYEPYQLCGMTEDASWGKMLYYWGADNLVSGSAHNSDSSNDDNYVKKQFKAMKEKFSDAGYPVLIGEYGALWRSMPDGENQDKHNASIKFYHKTVNEQAIACGMIPFVWDTNGCAQPSDDVLNRRNNTVWNQYAMDGITEGVAAGVWPY